jgi:hypothetical protein
MIKRIITILFFIPFLGWSQRTLFTAKEDEFVGGVLETIINNTSLSTNEIYSELDLALQKVPYHPGLVQYLLRDKLFFTFRDYEFGYEYCKKLDDYYLSTFQPLLIDPCAYVYYVKEDLEGLYNRVIPLIKDESIKGLYLAAYYYEKNNEDDFIKHAKYSLNKSYKYESLNFLRDVHLFNLHTIVIDQRNANSIKSYLKDYEKSFFISNLPTSFYLSIIEDATYTLNFDLAERLINYVKELDTEKYKYLYPIIAYYHSYKGEESLAAEALEKAFEMDQSGFLNTYPVNIAHIFTESIFNLSDFKTKEQMFDKGIRYFENVNDYKIKFMLGKSMLYASKDLKEAKAMLKECEPYLSEVNYNDFNNILMINNEMHKKKPDYRKVNTLLNTVVSRIDMNPLYFQKIMFCYRVNYKAKKTVFTLDEILADFDKILNKPLSKADEQYYLIYKFRVIKEYDNELLVKEIDKLDDDFAQELSDSMNVDEINSEKPTNQTKPEDINTSVDFITIKYLHLFSIK